MLCTRLQRWDAAERDLQRYIELEPLDAAFYAKLGDLRGKQDRTEDAISSFAMCSTFKVGKGLAAHGWHGPFTRPHCVY